MSTTSSQPTYQSEMNKANPNNLADLIRAMKFGNFAQLVKVTFAALTAAAAIDITTAAAKAAATISGITLATGENLPPIRNVVGLRVTAVGTGATGPRVVVDSGGTPIAPNTYAGHATLSDDGKTLTFEGTVTGFVLLYEPQSAIDLTGNYPA